MKKYILIACLLFLCTGCGVKKNIIQDLNLVSNDMMSYETMSEPSDHFYELTLKEALRLFEEGGSGILLIRVPPLNAFGVIITQTRSHRKPGWGLF